jgi:SAM-dependent methyltransferase
VNAPTADTAILVALVALAHQQAGTALLAFRSLVGAYQYRRLYALFRRYVPVGAPVLDWGIGSGHFSYYLVQCGYQATGFSLTTCPLPAWLPQAAYRLVQGDPQDPVHLPFPEQSFTAVASIGVLEHVRETGGDELGSLREIRRILQPGGWFICYHFPNRYSLIEAVVRCLPRKHSHRYRFTRRQIRQLLQLAGLELVETYRYGLLPRNIWGYAPSVLRNAPLVARTWDALDRLCSICFAPVCQNHAVIARRPASKSVC